MPIIDLTLTQGRFTVEQKAALARDLTQCLLKCDVTRDNPKAPAINWCYIHELPPEHVYVAGEPESAPHYRVDITVMHGAMSPPVKDQIVQDMTHVLLTAEGHRPNPLNASRVWITFHEIEDGNWGAGGRIYRLADLMAYLAPR